MSRIVRRSARERAHLVAAYHASDLTQEAFARQRGVNVGTLRSWLYRGDATPRSVSFVEVAMPAAASIVVELGCGVRVQFSAVPSAAYLAELARALAC